VTDNDGLTGTDTAIMYISNSIQDLIDAASPGDTVNVPADVYWERIIINKSLTLIGEDKNTTIIDGWGLYGDEGPTVTISASNVTLQGFTITNGSSGIYAPIYYGWPSTSSDHLTITDNIITSNKRGISLTGSSHIVISNNIIRLNGVEPWGSGAGIYIYSDWDEFALNNTIIDNIIDSNGRYGISIDSWDEFSTDNVISGNIIINHTSYGIRLYSVSNNIITNNNISDSSEGISLFGSNNTVNNNNIWNCGYGIELESRYASSNDNLIVNNTLTNNTYGLLIYARERLAINNIVRTSWEPR
jgi:parallel beta-helix repeat protein